MRYVLVMMLLFSTATAGELSKPTAGDRLLWLGAGYTTFTLFDFLIYPLLDDRGDKDVLEYRLAQIALQGIITYILVDKTDWRTGVAFNLIWWTWGCDLGYYGLYEIGHPGTFRNEVMGNRVTWASWTPYGLMRGNPSQPIAGKILITQSGIGAVLSLTLVIL